MSAVLLSTRQGQYSILEVALPGRESQPAGVLLFDPDEGRMGLRLRRDWAQIAEPEDAEVLALIEDDLSGKIHELGPDRLYSYLEGALSSTLRISDRDSVLLRDFGATLNRLYNRLIPATVLQFRTHLPMYSCRAAAGKFGEQMHVEDEGWIEAPADLRLTDDMFVARVVGRSMEPEIPDGSLCVFRASVVGSRQGKKLLVENFGESAEGGERYTVKRYRSRKVIAEDGRWQHEQIVMEPLNPEFDPWEIRPEDYDRVRVLAEFVRVIE